MAPFLCKKRKSGFRRTRKSGKIEAVKQTNLQQDYSKFGGYMQLALPIETSILIPADDSVRLLSQVMEELDYSKLYRAYSPNGRNPAVSPKNLFKVLVYGYMNNLYTSRGLETACLNQIPHFIYSIKFVAIFVPLSSRYFANYCQS